MLIPFATQSKTSDRGYSGERLVNYFIRPAEGVSQGVLIGASGVRPVADLGAPVRAIVRHRGQIHAVANGALWRIDDAGPVRLGGVQESATTQMASGAQQIAIVAGGRYYLYDGDTVQEYMTGAITSPRGVAFQDGYFLVIGSSSNRADAFTISSLDNGAIFAGLDFAFAENAPDDLVGIVEDHGEIWLFGSSTIEVFFNSGAADFPFQRNQGALIEHGCINGATIAKEDNAVFWVGDDGVVYRSGGGTPEVISTREIEETISNGVVQFGFTFFDRGHKFYAVGLEGKTTLCFDLTTRLWVERARGVDYKPWSVTCATASGGTHYFGTSTGKVAVLDKTVFTDDGGVMVAEAISVPVVRNGNPFSVARAQININSGHYDIGREPQVVLQTTKDGHTWARERWRKMGRLGEFYKEIRWHGLGRFKRFQVRLRITDEVPRDIYGGQYE